MSTFSNMTLCVARGRKDEDSEQGPSIFDPSLCPVLCRIPSSPHFVLGVSEAIETVFSVGNRSAMGCGGAPWDPSLCLRVLVEHPLQGACVSLV